jgi:hypothetical protein
VKFTKEQIELLNAELPAVAAGGPWGTGKTLFALTRPVMPGKQTWWVHTEPSGANYASLYPVRRLEVNHMGDLRGFFTELAGAKGGVSHVIFDTIAPIEQWFYNDVVAGLDAKGKPLTNRGDIARYAKDNAAAYGEVKNRENAMLAWVKSQVDAVTITSHLRTKYVGNQPTPNKEPRTKEGVYQFVSLFLVLEKVKGQGAPAGAVLKTTLLDKEHFKATGEPKPVLPPRLPTATWQTIINYLEEPVDMANLTQEETSNELSDVEALRLMAAVAQGGEAE